jgi:protein SCO1
MQIRGLFRRMLIATSAYCLLIAVAGAAESVEGSAQSAAPKGGDFTLQSVNGPVSTTALRGKVILLYFGYTQCPDICPTSLSLMAQALNELTPEELARVVGLFVSVDPKRDTTARLAEYVGYFHPNFIGLTGTPEAVAAAAKLYGAQYSFTDADDSAMGYIVNHSATIYLIDQAGVLRFAFPHGTSPETMLGAIRMLFDQG